MKIKHIFRGGLLAVALLVAGLLLIRNNPWIPGKENSVAVLPFRCLDPDSQCKGFREGFQERLLSDLNETDGFKVVSKISSDRYRDTDETISAIGKELHADYVIEGTIALDDTIVRVWIQLIRAKTDQHVWASVFNGNLKNFKDFQVEVSKEIAGSLDFLIFGRK